MNALKNLLAVLLALAVLGAAIVVSWLGGAYLARIVRAFDWTLEVPLLVSVLVSLSALALAGGLRWAKRQEGEHRLREARRPLYENLTLMWRAAVLASRDLAKDPAAGLLPEDVGDMENLLALRASTVVLRRYHDLRRLAAKPDVSFEQIVEQFLGLVIAMRRDLGLDNRPPATRVALQSLVLGVPTGGRGSSESARFPVRWSDWQADATGPSAAAPAHRL